MLFAFREKGQEECRKHLGESRGKSFTRFHNTLFQYIEAEKTQRQMRLIDKQFKMKANFIICALCFIQKVIKMVQSSTHTYQQVIIRDNVGLRLFQQDYDVFDDNLYTL